MVPGILQVLQNDSLKSTNNTTCGIKMVSSISKVHLVKVLNLNVHILFKLILIFLFSVYGP
jgi:hypothetical protein